MERDLEDLKTRMRRALEDPKKVAEIAVAALRSPYNAYKVVLESTGDKQLAQDWRNTLMLKRDQGKYGINFSEELISVFPQKKKEVKMLEVLEEEKRSRESIAKVGELFYTLFKNLVSLLIEKGTLMYVSSDREAYLRGQRLYEEVWVSYFDGVVSENGVSKPIHICSRLHFINFPQGNVSETGDNNRTEVTKRLKEYLTLGDFHRACPDHLDILRDISIDIGDEKGVFWWSVDRGNTSAPYLFKKQLGMDPVKHVFDGWDRIDFIKELNVWIEQQIRS